MALPFSRRFSIADPVAVRSICLSQDETGELERALAAASLPSSDLREPGRTFFRFEDGDGLIGFGGWEGCGSDRLLRSLVIAPERRSQGLGAILLEMIEQEARDAGATSLHLLTTTASPFFRAHGYEEAARDDAPASIRASEEFSALCPASATYMVKPLVADEVVVTPAH